MRKTSFSKRIMALFLSLVMVIGLIPSVTLPTIAAEQANLVIVDKIADDDSFDNWKDYYGNNSLLPDGTRGVSTWKAGGVWTDKSVYADATKFPGSVVMDNPTNNFLVALSALASSKEIVGKSTAPTDTMLILDLSGSMIGSTSSMVNAANQAIIKLLSLNEHNRVGVVLYSGNSNTGNSNSNTATVLLPLNRYTTTTVSNGVPQYIVSNSSEQVSVGNGVSPSTNLGSSKNTIGGTYTQNGIFKAMNELVNANDKKIPAGSSFAGVTRLPIMVLMSDGEPSAATKNYTNIGSSDVGNGTTGTSAASDIAFLTQLTMAYAKREIETAYGTESLLYTLGYSVANNAYAKSVLDPENNTDDRIDTLWDTFNNTPAGGYFNVNDRGSYESVKKHTDARGKYTNELKDYRYYTDKYIIANHSSDLANAFVSIVEDIGLQSVYSPTLIPSNDADTDGYITVQDELGAMMLVKDIKGILLGNTLFSGEELAKSMNSGALGSVDSPTAYGDEFVRTVMERLDLTDKTGENGATVTATSQAQQLIQAAYLDEQLSYDTSTGAYSNFIGWYGDENNAYLGFWDKDTGITATGAPTGAKYINKSYGYLGGTSSDKDAADMMHVVVMVRTEIATGHQTVLFKIPSSLIPTVEYKVTLDTDSLETAEDISLTVEETDPIRLVYEVGLSDDVNNINIAKKVEAFESTSDMKVHKDADGNYLFYANSWDTNNDGIAPNISALNDAQKLDITQYLPESHFVPNTTNERFYVQEDSVVYTQNDNRYTPVTSGISANETYYFPRTIVTIVNGTARAITQYEQLQPATVQNSANFQKNAATGYWEVKAGTIRQQLSNVILPKTDERGNIANPTGTIANTDQLWVNVTSSNPEDYNIYSFLGNNGKLTVAPATGIKITKDVTELADGAAASEEFAITVTINAAVSNPVVTDADGNLLTDYTSRVTSGKTEVILNLADGESAVISGLSGGVTYTVSEAANSKYTASYTGATATVANTVVENLVTNTPTLPGGLFITKEVEHAFGGEVFPKDYEFEFEVTFKDADGNPIEDTFQLENNYDTTLKELPTNANGVMHGRLRHGETVYIKDIPAGATVTVEEVNIPSNYTSTAYESINQSGEDFDNDGVVTIVSDKNATVVVTNTYTPDKVEVDINFEGTKNFDATEMNANSEFTFKLQEYKNGQWADVEGKTVTVVKGENASKPFAFTPLNLEFDKPGVHSYQIMEVKGDNTDITYDRSVYTFSVNVVIDSKGNLNAEVVGHNEKENIFDVSGDSENGYVVDTVFTNYYHKTATSIEINKTIEDKANSGKTPAGFVIETYEAMVDANDNWIIGDFIRSTVTDAQGEALLVRNYDNTDFINNDTDNDNVVTYYFIIKEKDTQLSGWTYDDSEYRVTVVLEKATDGTISADFSIVKVTADGQKADLNVSGDKATINFANTYTPNSAEVDLNVTPTVLKDLKGRDLTAGEFKFAIFKDGEADFDSNGMLTNIEDAIAIGTNDANGNVTFAPVSLTFSQVDKYEYDIIEVKGSLGGVTYDPTIYDLVVEVTDDGKGALQAEHYFEDSVTKQVTFHNTYTVKPTEVVIEGIKSIQVNSGVKILNAGDYTFQLFEADAQGEPVGDPLATTTNLANGTFKFNAIEYDHSDKDKTFRYVVLEKIPADATLDVSSGKYVLNGITYSNAKFVVEVEITDNGDGTLSTVVTNNGVDNIKFVNIYNSNPASVTLNGTKELDGRNLQNGEYSFILHESNAAFTEKNAVVPQNGADFVTNDSNGAFTFNIKNLGMGYHYYILSEVIPEQRAAGISYDTSVYYITVQVSDSGNGQMNANTAVSHSGQSNVSNPPIVFKNVYSPEPGELPLSGTKTYNGGKALEDDVFSVGLYNDENDLIQTAFVKASSGFAFENLKYQAADVGNTYTYTVKEIIPDGATNNGDGTYTLGNNIYDGSIYTLTVRVTDDDKDGALEINSVLTKGSATVDDITFTNTFVPDPITYTIEAKKTYEKGLKGDDFEFTLVSADNKTNVNQSKKNDADGDIKFDAITFSEVGSYKFTVKEIGKILGFIRYSAAEYDVTITVVNENGVLRVSDDIVNTENTGEVDLEFINVYVIDGEDEITLRGTKKLTGDRTQVNANEFEFGLYDADGDLIESVKNDANGNFAFTTLEFDETDVPVNGSKQITYTIQEIAGNNARYTYDNTIYTVVVTVKDNDQGGVTATYTVNNTPSANAEIAFTNGYTNPAPVTYTPLAKKNYNKTLNGGEFKFKLEGNIGNTPVSQEKTNAEGGSITFDTLSFPEAGTYTFTVKEIDKILGFIQYSAAEYELVVTIVDTNGVLSLGTVTVNNDPNGTIEFTNTYVINGEDEITLRGSKALTGGRTSVNAGEFEFGLFDANDDLIESVKNDADGNFAFTTLKFDETDVPVNGSKQITYTVKEIKGTDIRVTYDETVYTVVVTVMDNEQGGVTASYTVNSDAAGLIAFTNIYTPKPEDITVDLDIIKTVVNKGSEKIGPEGFEFLLNALADGVADTTVKADENGKAKVTLTFTEDDIGNTYTYKLTEVNGGKANVTYSDAEYTITVAIELNENNELVATLTKNSENVTAVVAEFENIYDYTPVPEYPDSPQTGDNSNLHLWFALLFVSGGGILGTTLYGRKRKEEAN